MTIALGGRPRGVRPHEGDARVRLVRGEIELASWPLPGGGRADLSVVDELARLQLAARRRGCAISLQDACSELVDLLYLVGLGEVVPQDSGRCVEMVRQAERGEEAGVEEVVMPDDPVA